MRYLVTRHPGAREWVRRAGVSVDRVVAHLDPLEVQPGDVVIGILPVHLAAAVCARGARYVHICVNPREEERGRELTCEEMEARGAYLREFRVEEVRDETV